MEHDDDRSRRHVPPLAIINNNQLTMEILEGATGNGEASQGGKGRGGGSASDETQRCAV